MALPLSVLSSVHGVVPSSLPQSPSMAARSRFIRQVKRQDRNATADSSGANSPGNAQATSASPSASPAAATTASPATTAQAATTTPNSTPAQSTPAAVASSSSSRGQQQPQQQTSSSSSSAATQSQQQGQPATTQQASSSTAGSSAGTSAAGTASTASSGLDATSSSATSASSAAATASDSTMTVPYTTLVTKADGSTSTSTGVRSETTSLYASGSSGGSSNTGKTWGIVGGVLGGLVVVVAIIFIVYRLTQRRFSDLDEGDEHIKWPELKPDSNEGPGTLNPFSTHRTEGAGIGDDDEKGEYGGGDATQARAPPQNDYVRVSADGVPYAVYGDIQSSNGSSHHHHQHSLSASPEPMLMPFPGQPQYRAVESHDLDMTPEEERLRAAQGRLSMTQQWPTARNTAY